MPRNILNEICIFYWALIFILYSYVTNPDRLLCILTRLGVERPRICIVWRLERGLCLPQNVKTGCEVHLVPTRGYFTRSTAIGMTTCLHLVPTFRILAARSALLSASLWCGAQFFTTKTSPSLLPDCCVCYDELFFEKWLNKTWHMRHTNFKHVRQ